MYPDFSVDLFSSVLIAISTCALPIILAFRAQKLEHDGHRPKSRRLTAVSLFVFVLAVVFWNLVPGPNFGTITIGIALAAAITSLAMTVYVLRSERVRDDRTAK